MNINNDPSISTHQNSNFYVRVKRNRDHYPIEQICIIEDVSSTPLKKQRSLDILVSQLSGLSSTSSTVLNKGDNKNKEINEPKRLILKRIRTFNDADQSNNIQNALLSTDYHSGDVNKPDDITKCTNYNHKDMKLLVTNSIKTIISNPDDSEQSIAIIDMQQIKRNNTVDNMANVVDKGSDHIRQQTNTTLPIFKGVVGIIPNATITSHSATTTRILDPATRLLDKGITSALKTGDFNQISAALIQGADANYQTSQESGGYTALMVASIKGNVRMVKRILQKAVDVLRVNAAGYNAYELLIQKGVATLRNQQEIAEIKQLLLVAMRKAEEMRNHLLLTSKANEHQRRRLGECVSGDVEDSDQGSYVYDIYHCVNPTSSTIACPTTSTLLGSDHESNEEGVMNNTSSSSSEEKMILDEESTIIPEVKVEGLKILKDGNIDIECLIACYDSDWSDLGDDEDPDSNDERYYGNDYPEEADEEIDDDLEDDDDDDIDNIQSFQRNVGTKYNNNFMEDEEEVDDDENSDYDINNNSDDDNYSPNQASMLQKDIDRNVVKTANKNNDNLFNKQTSFTERRYGVGKVVRPHVRFNDNDNLNNNSNSIYQSHNTESLQKLWGEEHSQSSHYYQEEEGNPRTDNPFQHEKTQRIEQMNQRTGMVFAGNPKEFDSSGLPKYAEELSDDDIEIQLNYIQDTIAPTAKASGTFCAMNYNNRISNKILTSHHKPSLDTIAYDFELDKDADD